jgi:hypothetical protein
LHFSVPSLSWRPDTISTTKTTVPLECPKDELILSTWTDFVHCAQKTLDDVADFELEKSSLDVFEELEAPDLVVNCEDRVLNLFRNLIGEPLCSALNSKELLWDTSSKKFRFYPKDSNVLLKPDLCLYKLSGDALMLVAVVEDKSPWAFNVPFGNLVEAFEKEKRLAAQRGDDEPTSKNRMDTKVTRAVSQLWGYLSANHLKYGVITTFSHTYFFRRLESSSTAASCMEVTPAISVNNGPLPIYVAWFHFMNLLKEDFLYTSPFSSPLFTRKLVEWNVNQYEPIRIDLGQIYFESPFAFGGSSSVTTGKVSVVGEKFGDKSFILKVFDGSKDPDAKALFDREIPAYQLLQSIQGKRIPHFYGALIASEFVYILVLEKLETASILHAQSEELAKVRLLS